MVYQDTLSIDLLINNIFAMQGLKTLEFHVRIDWYHIRAWRPTAHTRGGTPFHRSPKKTLEELMASVARIVVRLARRHDGLDKIAIMLPSYHLRQFLKIDALQEKVDNAISCRVARANWQTRYDYLQG